MPVSVRHLQCMASRVPECCLCTAVKKKTLAAVFLIIMLLMVNALYRIGPTQFSEHQHQPGFPKKSAEIHQVKETAPPNVPYLQLLFGAISLSKNTSSSSGASDPGTNQSLISSLFPDLNLDVPKLSRKEAKKPVPAGDNVTFYDIQSGIALAKVNLLEELSNRTISNWIEYYSSRSFRHSFNSTPVDLSDQIAVKPSAPFPNVKNRSHVILVTTWRSGSTFLGELLASQPGAFSHYEPLMMFGVKQVREPPSAPVAVELLRRLLHCDYSHPLAKPYVMFARHSSEMFARNVRLWKACHKGPIGTHSTSALCYNPAFLTQICALYPVQVMKTVRLRLRWLKLLLADPSLNTQIIYLVRDPRGIMSSRKSSVDWCVQPDCANVERLCNDMEDDIGSLQTLATLFPKRVILLRYEDMALSPRNETQLLWNQLGLQMYPPTAYFLRTHTTANFDKPWSTQRESRTRVYAWKEKLLWKEIVLIQEKCSKVMDQMGYQKITHPSAKFATESVLPKSSIKLRRDVKVLL